uniref:Uncharacterized protein n=1 Tax=Oryza rufipogon TaxID=4529 RepID=A0A0E0PL54_ORYRU
MRTLHEFYMKAFRKGLGRGNRLAMSTQLIKICKTQHTIELHVNCMELKYIWWCFYLVIVLDPSNYDKNSYIDVSNNPQAPYYVLCIYYVCKMLRVNEKYKSNPDNDFNYYALLFAKNDLLDRSYV